MKVKTAKFNGVRYDVELCGQEIEGLCDSPKGKPSIMVMTQPYTKVELETLIHECLHASDWSKSEEKVTRIARETARLLWRLGYRREQK